MASLVVSDAEKPRGSLTAVVHRRRFGALTLLVVALVAGRPLGGDWPLLGGAAHDLVHGEGLHVYAMHSSLQAGPLAVVLCVLLLPFGAYAATLAAALIGAVGIAAVAIGERCRGSMSLPHVAAAALVLASWTSVAAWSHVDDAVALGCTAIAMLCVERGRRILATLAVGVALAAKPWAVAAIPMLFGLPDRRARAAFGAMTLPLLTWLPFILGDRSTTSAAARAFVVNPTSPVHLLGLHAHFAPPWLRAAQLTVILVAAAVAARYRGWMWAPAAGLVARLLLDPAVLDYYVAGTLLAVLLAELVTDSRPWRTVSLYMVLLVLGSVSGMDGVVASAWLVVLLVILVSVILRLPGRQSVADGSGDRSGKWDRRGHSSPRRYAPMGELQAATSRSAALGEVPDVRRHQPLEPARPCSCRPADAGA